MKRFWTIKKISLISILVATSVAFVLVFTSFIPIAIFPAIRHSIGGLPVKITGFIFGPWIGALTGLIAYFLSFSLRPVVFHYSYILVWMLTGFVPGVIGWLFNRLWKGKNNSFIKSLNKKISNVNFLITILILILSSLCLVFFIKFFTPDSFFDRKNILYYRSSLIFLSCFGFASMLIAILVGRFFTKPKFFNTILIIVSFSAITEVIIVPIMAWGDMNSLFFSNNRNYLLLVSSHYLISPFRIWTNLFVIIFAYNIVSPLIFSKIINDW